MQSPNLVDVNIDKIADLFPNCITEDRDKNGNVRRVVDFDMLRQELSVSLVEGPQERYTLCWPGKNEAILTANAPIAKTLRPCEEESVDFENTRNIFIEGDNLDALKLLQETYLNKVKIIYIDPPYNTGSDFIYEDDFAEDTEAFFLRSNQKDDVGNRMVANTDSNGRFHSDWLTMMFSRLRLSKNLLTDDGVIFISIGDREIENTKKICAEIFGEANFVATAIWEKKNKGAFLANDITNMKDYVVIYCKSKSAFKGLIGEIAEHEETYPCVNAPNARDIRKIPAGIKSKYREKNYKLSKGSIISADTMSLLLHSDLKIENGVLKEELIIEGNWRYNQEAMTQYAVKGELYLTQDLYLRRIVKDPRYKTLKDLLPRLGTSNLPANFPFDEKDLFKDGWGTNEDANEELRQILGEQNLFGYPKPTSLIAKLICSVRDKNSIVMDFFAGSGTTAHAINLLNLIDAGKRKYILIQLPEVLNPNLKDQKAAAQFCDKLHVERNIAELTKERIRRAGKTLKKEYADKKGIEQLDLGFRVFKIDTSNMKDVYYTPDKLKQQNLELFKDHIKADRRPEDLLFQVFIDWGLDLSLPITKETIDGKAVFFVDTNALVACFDSGITEELVKKLAKHNPLRVVFRDDAFGSDSVKINVEQIFKLMSPITDVKSI